MRLPLVLVQSFVSKQTTRESAFPRAVSIWVVFAFLRLVTIDFVSDCMKCVAVCNSISTWDDNPRVCSFRERDVLATTLVQYAVNFLFVFTSDNGEDSCRVLEDDMSVFQPCRES